MPPQNRSRQLLSVKEQRRRSSDGAQSGMKTTPVADDGGSPVEVTSSIDQGRAIGIEKATLVIHDNNDPGDKAASKVLLAIDVAIDVSLILREASEASSVLIPLKAFCTVFYNVLQAAREKYFATEKLKSLVKRLEAHYRSIGGETRHLESNHLQEPPDEHFSSALEIYIRTLEKARAEFTSQVGHPKRMTSRFSSKENVDSTERIEAELEIRFIDLMRQVHNCTLRSTIKSINKMAEIRLSQLLNTSVNARGDRIKPLTPGTRIRIIRRLCAWAESPNVTERIFWLHDEAGTGKSALAAHMAKHWENEGVLAGRFFFNRNGGRNFRRLDRFCVTLMKEMSEHHPLAKANLLEILGSRSDAAIPHFDNAFQPLVTTVAEQLSKRLLKHLLFVIDALDECHEDDVQALTASMLKALPNCPGIRFLLTSRPTKEINAILNGIPGVGGKDIVLLDVKHGNAERDHDTGIYVRHALKAFSTADQNTVIQCASGVFLWATLACDTLLRTVTPRRVLDKFENNTPDHTMQVLYEAALEAALPPEWSSHDLKLLHAVLQGVSLTYAPVSIFAIQSFFTRYRGEEVAGEEFVSFFVKKLASIMKDGTPYLPIYILHPTFREFIEDQNHGAKFYISPPDGHQSIAIASLKLLMQDLTPNVLSLDDGESPFPLSMPPLFEAPVRLSLDIEAPLRYAVTFWATHASLGVGGEQGLQQSINTFFRSKLLIWIEWSSAIHELAECIEGLRRLQWAIRVQDSSSVNNTVGKWCGDVLQFLLHNNHIIEQCGLQAWSSALVFTPEHSLVYQTFSQNSLRPLPRLLTPYVNLSSDGSRVLHDSKARYYIVSFSSDGKRILASCSWSRLYNARSLKLIKELMDGPSGVPAQRIRGEAVAFSEDGSLIAGEFEDLVFLWDGFTGEFKEKLPRRHRSPIIHLKFALSDSVVVAIDRKHQILCWSVAPTRLATHRARAMQGSMHTDRVAAVASSSQHNMLATFALDKSIRIWDPESVTAVGRPMVGSDEIRTGLFSIDGTKVIAGYHKGVVGIWDLASQTLVHYLKSSSSMVRALAVSPNGKVVASGDAYLTLWDIETGNKVCPPIEERVSCLAFSRSGGRLISGSWSNRLTVWDIRATGETLQIDGFDLKGHTDSISAVAVSPSGQLVVSGSWDGTLRAWDTNLFEHADGDKPSNQTHKCVNRLAISHDGTWLLSAGEEPTLQLWDLRTGAKSGSLFDSAEGPVTKLVFSSSNSLWASAHSTRSGGRDVCVLWHGGTNDIVPVPYAFQHKQGFITCIIFTMDNTQLLTSADDMSIRSWAVADRSCIAKFDCTGVSRYITVCHDGSLLASISEGEIYLWDLKLHRLVASPLCFKVFSSDKASFLTFSPDGTLIATKRGNLIQIFDVRDNIRFLASFNKRHPDHLPYWLPTFSLDGRYLFCGTYTFKVQNLTRDNICPTTLEQVVANREAVSSPVSPLYVEAYTGKIYSAHWGDPLLVIPSDVAVTESVVYERTVAFGSADGRVFIMRFPEGSIQQS